MFNILAWVSLFVRVLISIGVLGVSLAMIRPKLPRTGYALAAAAGFDMLAMCCTRGAWTAMSTTAPDAYMQISAGISCFGVLQTTLVAALAIAAIVLMAKEGKAPTP